MMGVRQLQFANLVKDNFLDEFDANGNLMDENYETVVDRIYENMKDMKYSRIKFIQQYVENEKCKTLIALLKRTSVDENVEDNTEDSDEVDMNNQEPTNISIDETFCEEAEDDFDSPQNSGGDGQSIHQILTTISSQKSTRSIGCQISLCKCGLNGHDDDSSNPANSSEHDDDKMDISTSLCFDGSFDSTAFRRDDSISLASSSKHDVDKMDVSESLCFDGSFDSNAFRHDYSISSSPEVASCSNTVNNSTHLELLFSNLSKHNDSSPREILFSYSDFNDNVGAISNGMRESPLLDDTLVNSCSRISATYGTCTSNHLIEPLRSEMFQEIVVHEHEEFSETTEDIYYQDIGMEQYIHDDSI